MNKVLLNRLTERTLVHLFFFFFIFQIFSPAIGQRTLYLEYILVLLNPYFWHWLTHIRFGRGALLSVVPAVVLLPFHPIAAIKLGVLAVGVAFLVYCYERQLFRIVKVYLAISIAFALLQFFALISGNTGIAKTIGPSNLATTVWGAHATATYTNFYTIFYFPRVSGLSREAGFFASLLISCFLVFFVHSRIEHRPFHRKWFSGLLAGFVVSFSKASFALFPAMLIIRLRRLVDRIPLFLIAGMFLGALVAFWHHFEQVLILAQSPTYLSRFGGYALLADLDIKQLMFGVSDLSSVSSPIADLAATYTGKAAGLDWLGGLGGWCVENGILALLLYTLGLQALGIRGAGVLLVLLMTATVSIDTNQNFVLLSYYAAFMLRRASYRSASRRRPPYWLRSRRSDVPVGSA